MKTKILNLILIMSIIFGLYSCSCEKGSGKITTIKRALTDFDEIEIDFPGKVILIQGEENSVSIISDDNLTELVNTKVSRGNLKINLNECIKTFTQLEVTVTFKNLEQIEHKGLGNVEATNEIKSNKLKLISKGSGAIKLNISANAMKTEMSGQSEVKLSGRTSSNEIKISGQGSMHAYDLICNEIDIDLTNSGNANIFVTDKLDADLSGSGDIRYQGNPLKVNSNITGSGSIKTK